MKNLEKYLTLLEGEVDGLLLTSRFSRHYGAQFDIAEGVAIVTKAGCRYFTDSRYIESAQNGIHGFEVLEMNRQNNYIKRINDAIADFGITALGFEEAYQPNADKHAECLCSRRRHRILAIGAHSQPRGRGCCQSHSRHRQL